MSENNTDYSYIPYEHRLHIAVMRDDLDMVVYLIEECSYDRNSNKYNGETPFLIALDRYINGLTNNDIVSYLLDIDVNFNLPNTFGITPLSLAVSNGLYNLVVLLLKYGADVKSANRIALSSLGHSILYLCNDIRIFRLLVESDLSINSKSPTGDTMVDFFIKKNNTEIADYIVMRAERAKQVRANRTSKTEYK